MSNTASTNKLTLQPGLLVSLSSSVTGGVSYERKDLDKRCEKPGKDAMGAPAVCKRLADHDGKCDFSEMTAEEITRWETTRTISDKDEHEKATKVRNKARALITGVCAASNFGNLCLASREAELDARYKEAREMVDMFNQSAQFTRVSIYMMKGEIRAAESASGISAEIVELIDQMTSGISGGDEDLIRVAANKLTQLAEMLDANAKAVIEKAIAEARSAARAIVTAKKEKAEGKQGFGAQKQADKGEGAKKTLKAARKVLDMNADVMAAIEGAAKKAG